MAEPIGETATGTGKRLRPGEFLRDAEGGWFRVYDIGGGKLRLAPVTEDGKLLAPKSQWQSPAGAFENELGMIIQTDIGGNITTSRTIPWSEWAGGGGGGDGYAPVAYSSTSAAQEDMQAHDREMTGLNDQLREAQAARDYTRARELELHILERNQQFDADQAEKARVYQTSERKAGEAWQAEQNRLAEEAMLKRERLNVLQGLVEGFLQSQQRASEFVLQLQPDPFAFAAAAGGMPVLGTTPQQGYAQALTEFAGRPAPSMDPNAPLSAIEGGISTIMGQQFPLAPGILGGPSMSAGGSVPRGASGTFLVGEGGPEVMEVSPAGVTIKPLQGGFQYGGGVDYDPSTILQGLAPLYTRLGLSDIPLIRQGFEGHAGIFSASRGGEPFDPYGYNVLEKLGIEPSLVKFADSPSVYYRDPNTGALRDIPTSDLFNQSNLRWEDIVHYTPEVRSQFDFGPDLTTPVRPTIPSEINPLLSMPWMPMSRPLEAGGNIRAALPAPYKIAAQRRRMAAVNPQLYESTQYAYGDPKYGLPFGTLRTAEDILTPRGTARYPVGLR